MANVVRKPLEQIFSQFNPQLEPEDEVRERESESDCLPLVRVLVMSSIILVASLRERTTSPINLLRYQLWPIRLI